MKSKLFSAKFLRHAGACFLLAALVTGCAGNYGRYKIDAGILQSFKDNQLPSDYRYFYYGLDTTPYAVVGVEKKYDAGSNLWREVEPNTEKFKYMIRWIWEDYGYTRFAARILDPSGKPVGVLCTSIREVTFKFSGDNRIVVMPNTPFLWGPGAGLNSAGRYYGSIE
jgi:hypothetical protein